MEVRDQLHAPGRFNPGNEPHYPINRGLGELKSGQDVLKKQNISWASPNLNPGSSSP